MPAAPTFTVYALSLADNLDTETQCATLDEDADPQRQRKPKRQPQPVWFRPF
jgi:hypothetical protein